jgi:DnaJ-class molecular chaperone
MHEIYPQKYRACTICGGNGRIRCPDCKGEQTISYYEEYWDYYWMRPGGEWVWGDCPTCLKSETIVIGGTIKCPKCKGSGDEER